MSFSDKINLKTVSEPFISPLYTRNFGAKRDLSTNTLYILRIFKQPTEYVSLKKASQQAGGDLFLDSEMQKKLHACPSINKAAVAVSNHCSFLQFAL